MTNLDLITLIFAAGALPAVFEAHPLGAMIMLLGIGIISLAIKRQ